MDVAASSSEQRCRVWHFWLPLCLFLMSTPCFAQPETPISLADQRAKAVTQVVLGILSYARWPVEPAELHLCVVGPTEYTDDLLKGATQSTGRPVQVQRLLASNPAIVSDCNALYLGKLTDEERAVYKRGRNAKVNSVPKNAALADYHAATGLETLFGWLWLRGEKDRISELFELIVSEEN